MKHKMSIAAAGSELNFDPIVSPEGWRGITAMQLKSSAPDIAAQTGSRYADAEAFWRSYRPDADVRWVDFYTERTGVYDHRYVPNDVFYGDLDFRLNQPRRAHETDDKNLYDVYFPDVEKPVTVGRLCGGYFMDADYRLIGLDELCLRCAGEDEVVIKSSRYSCGGASVMFRRGNDVRELLQKLQRGEYDFIIQRRVEQHPAMAALNASSLNTVRLLTYIRQNGERVPLSAVVRLGKPGMRVDNVSSGGATVGITEDGRLKNTGYTHDQHRCTALPGGEPIPGGMQVPAYDKIVRQACDMHLRFPQHRLISWDFAVSDKSTPVFIEMNLYRTSIDFMQLNNGPLFGEYTAEILAEAGQL